MLTGTKLTRTHGEQRHAIRIAVGIHHMVAIVLELQLARTRVQQSLEQELAHGLANARRTATIAVCQCYRQTRSQMTGNDPFGVPLLRWRMEMLVVCLEKSAANRGH